MGFFFLLIPSKYFLRVPMLEVLKLVALVFSPLRDCGLIVYNLINGYASNKCVL